MVRIQIRSLSRNWPVATLRPALMTSQVVPAVSIASITIRAIITNSEGEADSSPAQRVKSAFAS